MTLAELKKFVADTRHHEGVSWYLRDDSPLNQLGLMYTMLVFNSEGALVETIQYIEERLAKRVPQEQLTRIAAARVKAGINPGFVRNYKPVNGEDAQSWFELCRSKWLARRNPMAFDRAAF